LHFVANSEWTAAQARRSGLLKYAQSLHTINLGLDVNQYIPVEKRAARTALRIPEGKFVIGFACLDFNERRKGADILAEALKTFPLNGIVLLVLGAGKWPQEIAGVQTITLGSLGSPRLQSVFYSALDVFALPSRVETFGLVALEAMACETPVVTYPVGGMAEVMVDGETGMVEPEIGSVAAFVRMLHWIWKHPKERVTMGVAARQRVIEKFSDSLMARHYTELYNELILTKQSFLGHSGHIVSGGANM
jgi:glycosyltransferase involved in cell wall biosynthesis